ncbi:hypothetical protein LOZ66_003678 [Ophidiomyces ophidiicola]|nr:hypothetical protein LOZ66_003678 [Ophidiomyces ophidiicola]
MGNPDCPAAPPAASAPSSSFSALAAVPAPVKRLFDAFPLLSYPPDRPPPPPPRPALYIAAHPAATHPPPATPSPHPQSLKWIAYLNFHAIRYDTVPSSAYASPNLALPFLVPAVDHNATAAAPPVVLGEDIEKWVLKRTGQPQNISAAHNHRLRLATYCPLIEHAIRRAWVHVLYLEDANFDSVVRRIYVDPCSAHPLVRMAIASQLRHAAREELDTFSRFREVDSLLSAAKDAFEVLSTVLKDQAYFTGTDTPGILDASLFAYTHLILDESFGWKRNPLKKYLNKYENLVRHRNRILQAYFE